MGAKKIIHIITFFCLFLFNEQQSFNKYALPVGTSSTLGGVLGYGVGRYFGYDPRATAALGSLIVGSSVPLYNLYQQWPMQQKKLFEGLVDKRSKILKE